MRAATWAPAGFDAPNSMVNNEPSSAEPNVRCGSTTSAKAPVIRIGILDGGPVVVMAFGDDLLQTLAVLKNSVDEQQSIKRPLCCSKRLKRRPRYDRAATSKPYMSLSGECIHLVKRETLVIAGFIF